MSEFAGITIKPFILGVDRLGDGSGVISIRCQHANHGGITFCVNEDDFDLDQLLEDYRDRGYIPLVSRLSQRDL